MRDSGQALARDQPAGAVPGYLQLEGAGPAHIDHGREAVARRLAAERARRQHWGAQAAGGNCLPRVEPPEEDGRRSSVAVTGAGKGARRTLAEHIRIVASGGQPVGKPLVVLLGQPGRENQAEYDDAEDVDDGDDPCRGGGDPGRGAEPHDGTMR